MTGLSEFYYYDIALITKLIRSKKAGNILLQVPEGLKALACSLLDELKDRLKDVEIHIDLSPSYGSCLIDTDVTSSYDLVINLGHEKYPYWSPPDNVYFIDLLYKEPLSTEVINNIISKITELGKNVAVYSTAQHKHEVPKLAKILSSKGINVINDLSSPVIFGCWFSDLDNVLGNIDAVLVISGGYFH
ncbi:MAG: diphthamide synthesis protein, partial [Desulfurococcales archaeon]|nr:diphthamide synthesis protein [Desulfurococcales archaeon]